MDEDAIWLPAVSWRKKKRGSKPSSLSSLKVEQQLKRSMKSRDWSTDTPGKRLNPVCRGRSFSSLVHAKPGSM